MTLPKDDIVNVAMHPALVSDFKKWLHDRNLHLAGPIRFDNEHEPFYIIGIGRRDSDAS
jgi:hypothetical protein